jgi:hypothetical protein
MKRFGHKFHAKPVNEEGHRFPSTLEWKYFKHLELLQKLGEVLFFLRQVPFHFKGGKYVCDFQVFYSDGSCKFIDVKGVSTSEFLLKKRIVEETYPIEIEIVKKGDF